MAGIIAIIAVMKYMFPTNPDKGSMGIKLVCNIKNLFPNNEFDLHSNLKSKPTNGLKNPNTEFRLTFSFQWIIITT